MKASYNGSALTLTFALINPAAGGIYALDLGKDHHNTQCDYAGRKHKHQWTERYRDKQAYAPEDITADVSNPVVVWEQFCTEAKIYHRGKLSAPPARQLEMF